MRGVNNQLASFFDNSTQLVAGLATYPKFVVMLVEQGHDSFEFAAGVLDMDLATDLRGAPESLTYFAGKQRVGAQAVVIVPRDYGVERDDASRNKRGRCFDHVARRSFDTTDHVFE